MKRRRSLGLLGSIAVWSLLALLAWLDSDGCILALRPGVQLHTSAIFGAIVAAVEIIGSWLGTAAAATVTYLAAALQWIGARLLTFVKATGAVFAKSWDALKIVYSDVLKPAIQWMSSQLKRLYDWLKGALKPVVEFLKKVRDHLLDYYKRFVQPVLKVIDVVRGGLRVLGDLGIVWARQLDRRLGQIEQIIDENFLRVLSDLNRVIDVVNSVFTFDRLLQRFTFIRTLQRDVLFAGRALNNARMSSLTEQQAYKRQAAALPQAPAEVITALGGWLDGETNDTGASVTAAVDRASAWFNAADV